MFEKREFFPPAPKFKRYFILISECKLAKNGAAAKIKRRMTSVNEEKTYALIASPNGKRIVKTIESAGAKVVLFPQIQAAPRRLDEEESEILSEAVNYDWLIFFDVLAVDYFLRKLEEAETDLFELDSIRICALGEAVADRLRFVQLHADVVPLAVDAQTTFSALTDYIGAERLNGKRFLIVKRESAEAEIKNNLTERGAIAAELEIYETIIEEQTENARLKALLKGGAIDEFVFASPEDLIALRAFLRVDSISDYFNETTISVADEVTFQSLREHRLNPRYFSVK